MLRISKDEAEEVFELMKDPVTGEWSLSLELIDFPD